MTAIFLLLGVLILSTLITKVGAVALMKTGLSQEASYFQARSAYTGVGYTTSEAETVLKHPVRRHIIQVLTLIGHLGVATVAATVFASMMNVTHSVSWWKHVLVLVLIVYSRNESLKELDNRSAGLAGESAHRRAIMEQARATEEEREEVDD